MVSGLCASTTRQVSQSGRKQRAGKSVCVCVCVCDIDHHAAEKKPGATGQRGREEGSRGDL